MSNQIARPDRRLASQQIPVAISARHVHLTQAMVEKLFGPGHHLTIRKPLSQPGQFAAEEEVTLVGPKRSIEGVRVLGPTRSKSQVEISRTDEFYLGVDAPIRASGHIEGHTRHHPRGAFRRGDPGARLDLCLAAHPHDARGRGPHWV